MSEGSAKPGRVVITRDLLRSGKVDPSALISRTFPLGAAQQAIEFAQRRDVMKVLLRPSDGPGSRR